MHHLVHEGKVEGEEGESGKLFLKSLANRVRGWD